MLTAVYVKHPSRTGNRVTCRDWFQLTLKEGLTVYRVFTVQVFFTRSLC
jgi:aminopeptidase N